ncbi:MAG: ATP-binding cassette domain-containing protein [Terriglobales bacterium]
MNALHTRLSKTHIQPAASPFHLEVEADFPPGVTAIFGVSGSGKSTWLECIAGLQSPESGTVTLGSDNLFDSAKGIDVPPARRGIGYIFQNAALFPHLTVRANVEYGLHALSAAERRTAAQNSMETFHVANLAGKNAEAISGGERQRVALARALVRDPRCLLLDEPFSALDYSTKTRIMEDVLEWNRGRQIPILLVTHALEEVLAMAGRVVVLEHGRVAAGGAPHSVLAAQRQWLLAGLASPPTPTRDLLS